LVLATAVVVLRAADYAPCGTLRLATRGADTGVGLEIDLDLGAGSDDGADVATLDDRVALRGELTLALAHHLAHVVVAGNDGDHAVASHVIVAAMMRPAQLFDPAGGSPAEDLKPAAKIAPYPLAFGRPVYPIKAVGNRTVLVEVQIRSDGQVDKATVVGTTSGFDGAALTAARVGLPARVEDKAVAGVAYLIFGFRMPVERHRRAEARRLRTTNLAARKPRSP
jgi:hypothetical protein